MKRQLKTNEKGLLEDENGKEVHFSEVEIGDFINGARVDALGDIESIIKNSDSPVSSSNNSAPAITDSITDLHEQNPQQLDESLSKKEKSAEYQTAQKEKREAEKPTEKKSSFGGLFSAFVVVAVFIGGFIFFFRDKGSKGVSSTSSGNKTEETGNGTETESGKTEKPTGTLNGVFNNG